tara:strand:- start:254 stop:454 length:201 start_codon:yes stop_codon:yes gene_type:complete
MVFKMKGYSAFTKTIAKDKSLKEGEYPESYTQEDIDFLKSQGEDIVRYEDLDEKGKAIWNSRRANK